MEPTPDRLRVMVVDDITASRYALCALVAELGHQSVGASNGEAALAELEGERIDIVLLDLLMPGLDGFEVTRRIRDRFADRWLPVIVTSSLSGDAHFAHALAAGADDCLGRPVSPELLDAKLRHYGRVLGMQSRLAAFASRQQAIVDQVADAVLTCDADARLEEANATAQRWFGGNHALAGRGLADVLGVTLAALPTRSEAALSRADGTSFPAEIVCSRWAEGSRPHYTLVVHDLTERRRIERMKDEFLATVSHELRTPLTSIVGALSLLASGAAGVLPPAARPLADVARRNSDRLSRLIDDVLDLTKLEGDQLRLHLRPASLQRLLADAIEANRAYAERCGVPLRLHVDAEVDDLLLDCDRFLQVMANLLSNAIKHSPTGEEVTVCLEQRQQSVRVTVRDRGPGVEDSFRSRMFEKFSQADTSDRRSRGGTGLGLYITRRLVERMGGRIGVESIAGQGAAFHVEFDLQAATASTGAAA